MKELLSNSHVRILLFSARSCSSLLHTSVALFRRTPRDPSKVWRSISRSSIQAIRRPRYHPHSSNRTRKRSAISYVEPSSISSSNQRNTRDSASGKISNWTFRLMPKTNECRKKRTCSMLVLVDHERFQCTQNHRSRWFRWSVRMSKSRYRQNVDGNWIYPLWHRILFILGMQWNVSIRNASRWNKVKR